AAGASGEGDLPGQEGALAVLGPGQGERPPVPAGAYGEVVEAGTAGRGAVHTHAVVLDLDRHPSGGTGPADRDPHLHGGGVRVPGGVGEPLPDDGDDVVGDVVVHPGVEELGGGGAEGDVLL